jgi:hypothetical protein
MSPQERAVELFRIFSHHNFDNLFGFILDPITTKINAINRVDFILQDLKKSKPKANQNETDNRILFYNQVKEEINKL